MADVLHIPEKSIPFLYRGFRVQLTFVRESKQWAWEFEHTVPTTYRGTAKTIDAARKEVRKYVDTIIGPSAAGT